MLKRIVLAVTSFLGIVQLSYAQESCASSENLLYYVDSEPQNQFMVPFIETALHDLVFANDKDCHLFSSINSLNIMMQSRFVENGVVEFYTFLNRDSLINQDILAERDRRVSEALNRADKFLMISIKPFNQLLEYEFILYDIEKRTDTVSGRKVNGVPVLSYIVGSSTFVDPQGPDYKSDIIFAIRQVFQSSNSNPIIKIKSYADNFVQTNFFSANDTIWLNSIVIDNDSPKERIKYHWVRATEMKDDTLINFLSEIDDPAQKIIISGNGTFPFSVWVTDGIGASDTCSILIHVIERPIIDSLYQVNDSGNNIVDIKYHSYLVWDKNYYDPPVDINLSIKNVEINQAPDLKFELYPLDRQSPNLSFRIGEVVEYERPKKFSDTITDVVICTTSVTYSSLDSSYKTSIRLFQSNQKVSGGYALYVTAKEKTVSSKSQLMILNYSNILPVDFSFEYVGLALIRGSERRAMFPFTLRMNGHLFPMLDVGLKIDIPFSPVVDTMLYIQPFLHPNFFGSISVNYNTVFPQNGFALQSAEIHLGSFHYFRDKNCLSGGLSTSLRIYRMNKWTEIIRFSFDILPIPNPGLLDGYGLYIIFSFQAGFIYQPIRSTRLGWNK